MYKRFFLIGVLIILGSVLSAQVVRIAVDNSPYYQINSNGTYSGVYGDLYEEAFGSVGYEIELVELPLVRGIEMFFANQVDAHSPGTLYITGDLRENIYSVPVGKISSVYVAYKPREVNSNIPLNGTLADRIQFFKQNNLTLGVSRTSPVLSYYKQGGLRIHETESTIQEVQMLKAGRIDYMVNDFFSTLLTIADIYPTEINNFDFFSVPPYETSMAFSKGNPRGRELFDAFQEGINIIKNNGTYMEIMERYWGDGNVPRVILPDDLSQYGVEIVNRSKIPVN